MGGFFDVGITKPGPFQDHNGLMYGPPPPQFPTAYSSEPVISLEMLIMMVE